MSNQVHQPDSEQVKLFSLTYSHAIQARQFEEAMHALRSLIQGFHPDRPHDFVYHHFVRPVLDDHLLQIKECRPTVRFLELYALRQLASQFSFQHGQSRGVALSLGIAGLRRLGQFVYVYSDSPLRGQESLVAAERIFGMPFTVRQLETLYSRRHGPWIRYLAPYCELYLTRDAALLPLNCPSSVAVERDMRFFGAKITSACVLTGISAVLAKSEASWVRKAALVYDLAESIDPEAGEGVWHALREELGDQLYLEAVKGRGDQGLV